MFIIRLLNVILADLSKPIYLFLVFLEMKLIFIVLSALVFAFLAFQIYLYFSTNRVESRPYDVIKKESNLEIRFYPSVKIAEYTSGSSSYKNMSSKGFGKLGGYIFGKNEQKENIAMTSPVEVDMGDSSSKMTFMMPSVYDSKDLPVPSDSTVKLTTTDDEYVAVLSFSGFANDETIAHNSKKLAQILKEENLTTVGNYRYLGYNPPYQLFGRKNEVVVRVSWEM